jgi:hypothetical protein
MEFHDDLVREGGLISLVFQASLEDGECQEYAAFSLAHLSSNRDYQTRIVEAGALKPLVAMMSVHAEPRHYAGLALLKLADNFENHVAIAEEGGIQALLRLARARSTDEELQYKAALTVGHLAANAVKLLPKGIVAPVSFSGTAEGGIPPHMRRAAAGAGAPGATAGAGAGAGGASCGLTCVAVYGQRAAGWVMGVSLEGRADGVARAAARSAPTHPPPPPYF